MDPFRVFLPDKIILQKKKKKNKSRSDGICMLPVTGKNNLLAILGTHKSLPKSVSKVVVGQP